VAVNSKRVWRSVQPLTASLTINPKDKVTFFWTVTVTRGSIFQETKYFAQSGQFSCFG